MRTGTPDEARFETLRKASASIAWHDGDGQPLCFSLNENGHFCGRNDEWHKRANASHDFVSFEQFTLAVAHRVQISSGNSPVMLFTASGQPFIIDSEDLDRVARHTWNLSAGRYINTSINGETVALHRFLMNPDADAIVDHINGSGVDNRKCNLRVCTQAENSRNSKKQLLAKGTQHCTSRYKGVSFRSDRDRWTAYIGTGKDRWMLGCYATELEAALAYNEAAIRRYGEFANLNHIEQEEDFSI